MSDRKTVEHWIEKALDRLPSDSREAGDLREALSALERWSDDSFAALGAVKDAQERLAVAVEFLERASECSDPECSCGGGE